MKGFLGALFATSLLILITLFVDHVQINDAQVVNHSKDIYSLDKIKEFDANTTQIVEDIRKDIAEVSNRFDRMAELSVQIREGLEAQGQDTEHIKRSEDIVLSNIDSFKKSNEELDEAIEKFKN